MIKTTSPEIKYSGTAAVRISAVDGTAFIDGVDLTATVANAAVLHTGTVAQANVRLSLVAGTAFVDSNAGAFATNITAHLGKYLKITDSAGKSVYGWIKEAGSAEGLDGASNVSNCENGATSPYDTFDGVSATGFHAIASGATEAHRCGTKDEIVFVAGELWKTVLTASSASGVLPTSYLSSVISSSAALGVAAVQVVSGSNTIYETLTSSTTGIRKFAQTANGEYTVSNLAVTKVLTPSTSGSTIVSQKGGTTYNWESQDAGFNPNDASNYTYTIYDRDLSSFTDGTNSIEIYDSAGRMLKGVLKAAGSAETVDFEVANGWTNNGYDTFTVSGTDITQAVEVGANNVLCYDQISSGTGKLFKFVIGSFTNTGTKKPIAVLGGTSGLSQTAGTFDLQIGSAAMAAQTKYFTNILGTYFGFRNTAGECDWAASGISMKQVLTPSTSGATIVSAKGGTTYNFSYKNASFTYNAASYYVVVKKIRGEVIMDTKTIDTGLALIDSTTANAFAAPLVSAAAYDFAAYRDGKHRLDIYSSAGALWAQGYISSTAPSGEAMDSEIIDAWTNNTTYPYETWTPGIGNLITQAVNTTTYGTAYKSLGSTNNLYKCVNAITLNSGTAPILSHAASSVPSPVILSFTVGGTSYRTGTAVNGNFSIYAAGATDFALTAFSLKKVTMPAATGVLLSTPGGARGYAFKHASFDPNATGLVMKVVFYGEGAEDSLMILDELGQPITDEAGGLLAIE